MQIFRLSYGSSEMVLKRVNVETRRLYEVINTIKMSFFRLVGSEGCYDQNKTRTRYFHARCYSTR